MTDDEWHRWLYKMGTGWLGWPDEVVLGVPIPRLCLAFEGLVEFQKAINGVKE